MNFSKQPRRPSVQPPAVAASPSVLSISDRMLKNRVSEQSFSRKSSVKSTLSGPSPNTLVNISSLANNNIVSSITTTNINNSSPPNDAALADELDYITVSAPPLDPQRASADKGDSPRIPRQVDKASRILGITHRKSMEPIPASNRTSIVSTRSVPNTPTQHIPTLPLTSLYLVSGLPKSPHTWTLADPDAVLGLHHSEGAVSRWWRPEVLGSTVSPGAGGGKKKKKNTKGESTEVLKGAGALSKAEVGKMLSKALKVRYSFFFLQSSSHSSLAFVHSRSRDHCLYSSTCQHHSHIYLHSPGSLNTPRTCPSRSRSSQRFCSHC
jgi:nicotinamide N-methyltransferase